MFTSYNPCLFTELICVASLTLMVTQHFSCKAVFLACCCHDIIFKPQNFDWAHVSTCGSCMKPQNLYFASSQFFVGVRLLLWGLGQSELDQECGTFLNMVAMWVITLVHDCGMLGREHIHRWTCVITRVKTVCTFCFPDNSTLLYHWIEKKEFLFCFRFLWK